MTRFFAVFGLSLLIFVLSTSKVSAEAEFLISYNNTYDVSTLGKTHVTQQITLTNKTSGFFASEFNLSIGKTQVENVKAQDNLGALETKVDYDGDTTTITIKFKQKVVGKGKGFSFTLSYDAPELAQKSGQIWEVNIPKLADDTDISEYKVTLLVPPAFGPLAFISPEPKEQKVSGASGFSSAKNSYIFEKSQLVKSGVSASFGKRQVYKFNLKYYIQNPTPTKIQTEIALPPDNLYQKVSLGEIDPKPQDVRVDKDGNWLARYFLSAKETVEISVSGFVEVYPKPRIKKITPQEDLNSYLHPQQYWEVENVSIKKKAQELKTAKDIYSFVVSHLSYNQKRLESETVRRQGAALAIENPKNSVCMEFTDLFVALARAAGIPAREVNGYAFSQNERLRPLSLRYLGADILHSWPEYYDPDQGWIQIDPTWENTSGGIDYFSKLDFNHIAFVHKGLSSAQPLPAGAYKLDRKKGGDIQVDFSDSLPQRRPDLSLDFDLPSRTFSGFPIVGNIIITNNGNQAEEDLLLVISQEGGIQLSDQKIEIGTVPPLAKRQVPLNLQPKSLFSQEEIVVNAKLDGLEKTTKIKTDPIFILGILIGLASLLIATLTGFSLVIFIKRLRSSQRKTKDQNILNP